MGVGARDDNLLFIESMNADCLPLRVCRFAVSLEHNCLRYLVYCCVPETDHVSDSTNGLGDGN